MNDNNLTNHQNNSQNSKIYQFWIDFCKWIRGHDNLYQCLIKIKKFIFNNSLLVLYLILIYKLYQREK